MKNKLFYFLSLIALSSQVFSAIINLEPQGSVKASEVNHNFFEIKSLMAQKNSDVEFFIFEKGSVISKDSLETEFSKVRDLGIEVSPLSSELVKASELNRAFMDMFLGVSLYDDIPSAADITFSSDEDADYSGNFTFINKVGATSIEIVSPPSKGNIVKDGTAFVYKPNPNASGSDSFTYRVFDGTNYSTPATVNVSLVAVNDAPVTQSQALSLVEDSIKAITLLASDVENDNLAYEIVTAPMNGVILGTGKNISYKPNDNYFGSDSFTFKVKDANLDSNLSTVSLTISGENDAPTLTGSTTLAVNQNSTASGSVAGSDIDSPSLSYSVVTNGTKGSVAVNAATGAYTYTAGLNTLGADFFILKANDGLLNSNNHRVDVTITGSGIILSNNVRIYYDGTPATSCNEYRTKNTGAYTYTGQTGDGLYSIKPDSGAMFTVNCDMSTEGGGWTMAMGFRGNAWDMSYVDNGSVGWTNPNGSGSFNNSHTNLNYNTTYWSPAYGRLVGSKVRITNGTDRFTWNMPAATQPLYFYVNGGGAVVYRGTVTSPFSFDSANSYRLSSNSTNLAMRWGYDLKIKCQDGRNGGTDNAVLGFSSNDNLKYCEGFGYPNFGNHSYRYNSRWYSETVGYNVGNNSSEWHSDTLYYNVWVR